VAAAGNPNQARTLQCASCGKRNPNDRSRCPWCGNPLPLGAGRTRSGPNRLADFVGQNRIKKALAERIDKARSRGEAAPHLLLGAAPEMGKVRLASAIAEELGVSLTVKHGNDFSDPLDLPGVLSNIRLHQVLIIEEVDSLDARVRAMLIEVLDKFSVEIMVGVGRGARLHSLPMPKFTFIGLSTRLYRVDPLLRRWCVTYEFEPYTAAEMNSVISRLARDRGIELSSDAAEVLVQQCAGSPGNALVLVERIRRAHDVPVIGIDDLPAIFAELGLGEYQPRSLQLRDALFSMSGREFENWLAGVFRRQGYTVSLTEVTGDHGIDLILTRNGQGTAVQCKRWTDSVGEPILRDFYGAMMGAGMPNGIVATNEHILIERQNVCSE